jgi:hypothetical protein
VDALSKQTKKEGADSKRDHEAPTGDRVDCSVGCVWCGGSQWSGVWWSGVRSGVEYGVVDRIVVECSAVYCSG